MRIILAPMEGVVDHLMRELLTEIGGFDLCVTEFVRVVDRLQPKRIFYRLCPELQQSGRSASGVPVRVQLLGQSPEWLAENALRAIELGSPGVDLNFGCPAPTVNRSKGGAVLLKKPDTLYRIIRAVRQAVPPEHPVTAKIRLGFDDKSLYLENAQAAAAGGASELTVHARSKRDGYRPPAYWEYIADIREQLTIRVIANGEIWSAADASRCREISGCSDLMLGRGALALPNLARMIKYGEPPMSWHEVLQLLAHYSRKETLGDKEKYYPNRIKQWLKYLKLAYPEADGLFNRIRTYKSADAILAQLHT